MSRNEKEMRVRLLIVDDQPDMVTILTHFMEPICSLIDHTDNLADAVRMASENGYNVIILDLRLETTGKEEAFMVIRKLKSYNCAVVVVSGILDPHLREDALAAGADAFVRKDGDTLSQSLLLAANIAVLHLPKSSFRSESFYEHVKMLANMAHA